MKKNLLPFGFMVMSAMAVGQCTPDFDFGTEEYGVSPDAEAGETFINGSLGVAYLDILHLKVPTSASALDTLNPLLQAFTIDTVRVVSVDLLLNGQTFSLAQLGLSYDCNNNGSVPEDPCAFLGGQQGCAAFTGVPTIAGVFNVSVTVTAAISGPLTLPNQNVVYDSYTLTIIDPNSISEQSASVFEIDQNLPNPFEFETLISYQVPVAGKTKIKVMNLIGETVFSKTADSVAGRNKIKLSGVELPAGVYMYSVEYEGMKRTKRMILSK